MDQQGRVSTTKRFTQKKKKGDRKSVKVKTSTAVTTVHAKDNKQEQVTESMAEGRKQDCRSPLYIALNCGTKKMFSEFSFWTQNLLYLEQTSRCLIN